MSLILFLKHLFNNTLKYKNALTANLSNWKSVYNSQIKPANLPLNKLSLIGQSVYISMLEKLLSDLKLTPDDKKELGEIITYFNLNENFTKKAKKDVSQEAVEKLITYRYEDNVLTEEENLEIIEFANYLGIENNIVERIKTKIAGALFKALINEKLKDKKLSPKEENELNQMLKNMQIDQATLNSLLPGNSLQSLAFAKLLWRLENGIFTVIENPPINLRKYEECYLSFSGKLLENKVVTTGYSAGSHGVSIRVAKGLSYRVGAAKAKPIKEEITLKHDGVLNLTNERIIFTSSGKNSFVIKFEKLLAFEVYSNAIGFIIEGKTYLVELNLNELELFSIGLTSSLRNYLDDENSTRLNALREIEESSL